MSFTGPQRIQIGTGYVFIVPLTGGNPAVPSSPRLPGSIQDFNFENTSTIKELRSNLQYPDDTAAVDKKATWKLGSGRFDIDLFNNMFGGETQTTGGVVLDVQEAHTIPATGPYTITVTNSGTYSKTLALNFTASGQPLVNVAGVPAQGEYSVASGVYTFNPADVGLGMLISYAYTTVNGSLVTVGNHVQGYGPQFEIYVAETYDEKTANVPNYLHCFACKATKFSLPLKRADYLIADIEGEAYANSAGNVYELYAD